MTIWIDNDGCPRVIRDLVFKVAERVQWVVCVVGNSWMRIPTSDLFKMVVVPGGFDAVDDHIAAHVTEGDLVVTSDVPLAARVVGSKAKAISSRGDVFDEKNVAERLAVRNLMQELRSAGDIQGGHGTFNDSDKKNFADNFDKLVSAMVRSRK
jgi:uncharacterized protein YaiI (UPF0178 family)